MYNVIIVSDEKRDKSYYYSYIDQNGNIECEDLPPYQDILKARSCYWTGTEWVFDLDKYTEIVTQTAIKKEADEKAAAEASAVPTNAELTLALMELAENDNLIMNALTELANEIAKMKGGN